VLAKAALIIPLHHDAQKVDMLWNLTASLHQFNIEMDLYAIFSFGEEKDFFLSRKPADKLLSWYDALVMEDFGPEVVDMLHIALSKNSAPSFKKFWALQHLAIDTKNTKGYTHFCVADSEMIAVADGSKFVQNLQLYTDELRTYPTMGGGGLFTEIVKDSWVWFDKPEETEFLREHSQNYSLYPWFGNLPVYDVKLLPGFFEVVPLKKFADRCHYFMFEHIVFQGYTILHAGYKLLDFRKYFDGCPSCEGYELLDPSGLPEFCEQALPFWQAVRKEPLCPSIVFLFHLDR
jgi:hypothetical protein